MTINEICSCGATISVTDDDEFAGPGISYRLAEFRAQHSCPVRPVTYSVVRPEEKK